jgi:hypothetical protein
VVVAQQQLLVAFLVAILFYRLLPLLVVAVGVVEMVGNPAVQQAVLEAVVVAMVVLLVLVLQAKALTVALAMLVSHPAQVVVAQGRSEEIQRAKVRREAAGTVSHHQSQVHQSPVEVAVVEVVTQETTVGLVVGAGVEIVILQLLRAQVL